MAVDPISRRLSYEDYLLFPEDGLRHELIGGEHFVAPSPSRKHQRTVLRVGSLFESFLEANPYGEILLAPFDVVLTAHDVVQPDLLFISSERADICTEQGTGGAPDLVIEVLSPRTRKMDQTLKLDLYEREGVREYWLLDPDRKTARVYRRGGERFVPLPDLSAAAGALLETPLVPGLVIPLAKIFR